MKTGTRIILIIASTVVAGLLALAGLTAVLYWATGGMVAAADGFLAKLGTGRVHEAWLETAPELKDSLDEAAFSRTVEQIGLLRYASRTWSARKIENAEGFVAGTVRLHDGEEVPMRVVLRKVGGGWRVAGLESQKAVTGAPPPPEADVLRRLVASSLEAFRGAVAARDFGAFHHGVSRLWQGQIDPAGLAKGFQQFLEPRVVLPEVRAESVVLDQAPAVDAEGVLTASGYTVTTPRLGYGLRFVFEDGAWRLAGVKLDTQGKATRLPVPPEPVLEALVHDSLARFGQAVRSGALEPFYDEISTVWRARTSPAALRKDFASFIENKVDLRAASTAKPRFTRPPAVDEEAVLVLAAELPFEPTPLQLTLQLVYEHPRWRLLGIKATTER